MSSTFRNTDNNKIIYQRPEYIPTGNSVDVEEETVNIEYPNGNMVQTNWHVNGIRLVHNQTVARKLIEFNVANDQDLVRLHFNLKGRFTIDYAEFDRSFAIRNGEHDIMYAKGFNATISNHDLQSETFGIHFTPEAFLQLTQNAGDALQRFSEKVLAGQPVMLFYDSVLMDHAIQTAVNDIIHCRFTGGIKKLFLLSKSIELLALQAEAYEKYKNQKIIVCKTSSDQERIAYARDYLLQQASTPPSLTELSKIAGINEYKLKRGFKEVFNNTVFGYLTQYRLEQAKQLLLDKEKTVGEIAAELGYSSSQHFSTAFKKKFGVSPGSLKK